MSTTTYGVNDALAVKLWSKRLAVEVSKATAIAPLIGKSSNSIIQLKDETQKGKGDKVTFGLRTQLTGDGVSSTSCRTRFASRTTRPSTHSAFRSACARKPTPD
jgi:hypothetical protein